MIRRTEKEEKKIMISRTKRGARLAGAVMMSLLMLGSGLSVMAAPQFGYGQWGRDRVDSGRVREIARRNGFEYGMREGRFDAQRRNRMNFRDSEIYRNGLTGYRQGFGSERTYRNAFRDGYEEGYRMAYSRNNGGWNNRWPGNRNGSYDPWDRRPF